MQNTGRRKKQVKGERRKEGGFSRLHVAVGVVKNPEGKILISLRSDDVHQGGLWEFPGGKVESGESVEQALIRELKEELGITAQALEPLIKIKHQYSDLNVLLDVYSVGLFSGVASGLEGQDIKWVCPDELSGYSFPEANKAIISAARLPSEYAILNGDNVESLLGDLQRILTQGVKLIQARVKLLSPDEVKQFFSVALSLCKQQSVKLLVNSAVKGIDSFQIDGIHLTSKDLCGLKCRPPGYVWVAASCHNQQEVKQAEAVGVDFVVLAPVLETTSHPDSSPLGWRVFESLTNDVNLPVFALGGMQRNDKYRASLAGAQGIAGISLFLNE